MRQTIVLIALLSASCAGTPRIVYRDRPVEVKVPVAQPCVAGIRPAEPKPLNQQYTAQQWQAFDARQKAAIVSRYALELKTYSENLNGATIACQ